MRSPSHILLLVAVFVAAGCSKEPPPRSVTEFVANELLLEAALVRCTQNRSEMRYDPECINAREAANVIEAREVEEHRAELDAQSEAKREALRQTQEAAAQARRRAAENQRRREEAEYLAQFGDVPAGETSSAELAGNMPGVVISESADDTDEGGGYETGGVYVSPYEYTPPDTTAELPTAGSNAPAVATEPEPETVVEAEETPNDLQSVRDELRRRNEDGSN